MKTLNVEQRYNTEWRGPDMSPDIEKHSYLVVKVMNSVEPAVGDFLSKPELAAYCNDDLWQVSIK